MVPNAKRLGINRLDQIPNYPGSVTDNGCQQALKAAGSLTLTQDHDKNGFGFNLFGS